jgi:hypothetical protein
MRFLRNPVERVSWHLSGVKTRMMSQHGERDTHAREACGTHIDAHKPGGVF